MPITKLAAVAGVLVLAGCASTSTSTQHPSARPPAPMSLLKACQILRADMITNGEQADKPTLQRISEGTSFATTVAAQKLGQDAASAEKDVGNANLWWIDAGLMANDCQSTGVQIPTLNNPA